MRAFIRTIKAVSCRECQNYGLFPVLDAVVTRRLAAVSRMNDGVLLGKKLSYYMHVRENITMER